MDLPAAENARASLLTLAIDRMFAAAQASALSINSPLPEVR
jgi:hypothetical protein